MICPQTKAECDATRCLKYGCCGPSECPPKPVECSDFKLFTSPPKPSMAEIERLVDAVKIACVQYGRSGGADTIMESACAALLAAIRDYGEGK